MSSSILLSRFWWHKLYVCTQGAVMFAAAPGYSPHVPLPLALVPPTVHLSPFQFRSFFLPFSLPFLAWTSGLPGFYHSALAHTHHVKESCEFWGLAGRCHEAVERSVQHNKHFKDMSDFNHLMVQVLVQASRQAGRQAGRQG